MVQISYNEESGQVISTEGNICLSCPGDCSNCNFSGVCTPSSICLQVNKLKECTCMSLGEEQNCFLVASNSGPSLVGRINGETITLTQSDGNDCQWTKPAAYDHEGLVIREYLAGGVSEFNCVDRCLPEFETGIEFPFTTINALVTKNLISGTKHRIDVFITIQTTLGTFRVLVASADNIQLTNECCIDCGVPFFIFPGCTDFRVTEPGTVTVWSDPCAEALQYDSGGSYLTGDRRKLNGFCFECIKDHTPTHPPTVSPEPSTNEFWAYLPVCS